MNYNYLKWKLTAVSRNNISESQSAFSLNIDAHLLEPQNIGPFPATCVLKSPLSFFSERVQIENLMGIQAEDGLGPDAKGQDPLPRHSRLVARRGPGIQRGRFE